MSQIEGEEGIVQVYLGKTDVIGTQRIHQTGEVGGWKDLLRRYGVILRRDNIHIGIPIKGNYYNYYLYYGYQ